MTASHVFSYVELAVEDLAAARSFYERAFGWEFSDYGPEYAGIRAPDGAGEIGGLDAGRTPVRGGPLVLMESADVEAAAAAVRAAGGSLTREIYAYPGGRRFLFTDPSGNELGVFEPDH